MFQFYCRLLIWNNNDKGIFSWRYLTTMVWMYYETLIRVWILSRNYCVSRNYFILIFKTFSYNRVPLLFCADTSHLPIHINMRAHIHTLTHKYICLVKSNTRMFTLFLIIRCNLSLSGKMLLFILLLFLKKLYHMVGSGNSVLMCNHNRRISCYVNLIRHTV